MAQHKQLTVERGRAREERSASKQTQQHMRDDFFFFSQSPVIVEKFVYNKFNSLVVAEQASEPQKMEFINKFLKSEIDLIVLIQNK